MYAGFGAATGQLVESHKILAGALAIHKIYLQICYLLYEQLIKQHYFTSLGLNQCDLEWNRHSK
jgi:hypothetical protein